jgi:hypothetical protein
LQKPPVVHPRADHWPASPSRAERPAALTLTRQWHGRRARRAVHPFMAPGSQAWARGAAASASAAACVCARSSNDPEAV